MEQKADGPFTDIGAVLDNAKKRLDLTPSDRMRVTLLFSDLIQEASYSSKYAGTYYDFADKYLCVPSVQYTDQLQLCSYNRSNTGRRYSQTGRNLLPVH